jgi:peptidyl-prolyl cis-trans isomerase D
MAKKAKAGSLWSKVQAAVVVVLVTLLSAVFVLEFGGPQSEGCAAGDRITYAARVHGNVITTGDFEAAYALGNFGQQPLETQRSLGLRELVLQGLVDRALLAREARRMGFNIDEEDVWRRIAEDGTAYLSLAVDAPAHLPQGEIPIPVRNEQGQFDPEVAKRFIQYYLRRNVGEFAQAQMEELLAERARGVLRSTVAVSPREVWDAFVQENERVRVAHVRFSPAHFRAELEPTEAELTAWMGEQADRLDREYQANKHRYTDLEKQVRARHILVSVSGEADEDTRDAAQQKAEDLHAQVVAGADFAELARAESDDPGSAPKGGDLGWNPKGRMVPAFDEAQFALSPGDVSEVVETQFGFHIIRVEEVREGDVPEAEAKREIAERLYREETAEGAARRAAEDALAKLKRGVSLEQLDVDLGGPRASEGDDAEAPEDTRGPNAPRVEESHAFARGENPLPAGRDGSQLANTAFELSKEDPLPEEPLRAGQDFYVLKVLERTHAEREDFTEDEQRRISNRLLERKADEVIRLHVQRLREQAEDDGAVRINPAVLSYGGGAPQEAS